MAEGALTALLVEDEDMVARSYTRHLNRAGIETYVAGSLEEARELLGSRLNPRSYDVLLLDLYLPDGFGGSLLPELADRRPRPAVIILSGDLRSDDVVEMLEDHDVAIPKPIDPSNLVKLVERLGGRGDLSRLIERFAVEHKLSNREASVLRHAVAGDGNQEIARKLGCATSTVATYWKRLVRKAEADSHRDLWGSVIRFAVTLR